MVWRFSLIFHRFPMKNHDFIDFPQLCQRFQRVTLLAPGPGSGPDHHAAHQFAPRQRCALKGPWWLEESLVLGKMTEVTVELGTLWPCSIGKNIYVSSYFYGKMVVSMGFYGVLWLFYGINPLVMTNITMENHHL